MADQVLVKEPLTQEMIFAGDEITRRLVNDREFHLVCSLWLYTVESNEWRLTVATPIVDNSGPIHAYQMIQGIIGDDRSAYLDLPLYSISVLRSNHALVRALRSLGPFQIQELPRGPRLGSTIRVPKRITLMRVQDVFIEDALVYYIE
jgi:hypothetical protein